MKLLKALFCHAPSHNILGICLSGGGALGFAHIGVLKALEENGIFPQKIVGSSMGAIIGSLYASGMTPEAMLQLVKDDKLYKVTKLMTIRPAFSKSGLSNHTTLRNVIKELIPHNSFDKLQKNLGVCVSNLNTAECEIVSTGSDLDKWVAASASIPGVFETIQNLDTYYVDGGLLNNMPAQSLKSTCSTIIGVDVLPLVVPTGFNRPTDTLAHSLRAVQHQNSIEGRSLCQFVIEPRAIDEYHEFSFDAYQAIYQHGYSATVKYITENPTILKLSDR